MKPETRVLRVVLPENGGPRPRSVLEGLARHYGAGPQIVDTLIESGALVKFSDKRHARYGLPNRKKG